MDRPVYLDCNATTPIEPRVKDIVLQFLEEDFGNAGSRTHEFGNQASKAVISARNQVAKVVQANPDEVIFTSGATESNNIAILGLASYGISANKKHIVSTKIEHKAVLEPLHHLARSGFEVTLISPTPEGWIDPEEVARALRPDTLLLSVMHVNNETGVIQPIADIADAISRHPVIFHCDAAQGFGKELEQLLNSRIDLISISAHKIFGPKGVGSLVSRKRGNQRLPLEAVTYGGGQERGLRPGTLPVHLIAGLGLAAEIAVRENEMRKKKCLDFKMRLLKELDSFDLRFYGDDHRTLFNCKNLSIAGIDSEAVMIAVKDLIAISNGSACTSMSHKPSHVLRAMGISGDESETATRWSWCHMTEEPDWGEISNRLTALL